MTGEEAVHIAQRTAEQQDWPWLLPVAVRRIDAARWRIPTHSGNRGMNIRMLIRDRDGLVDRPRRYR